MIWSNDLGDALRRIRDKNNLGQKEFAKICGISTTSLCHIETKRKKPRMETGLKIARNLIKAHDDDVLR